MEGKQRESTTERNDAGHLELSQLPCRRRRLTGLYAFLFCKDRGFVAGASKDKLQFP